MMNGTSPVVTEVVKIEPGGTIPVTTNSHQPEQHEVKSTIGKVKTKVKDVFHLHTSEPENVLLEPVDQQNDVFEDPAFNPSAAFDSNPAEEGTKHENKVESTLDKAAKFVVHPRQTIRNRTTKKAVSKFSGQRPITFDHDQRLLDAHDDLSDTLVNASTREDVLDTDDDSDVQAARERIDQLEQERHSLKSAWILGRHVTRVRVVHLPLPRKPRRSEFVTRRVQDQTEQFAWGKYLAYLALWYSQGFTARYIDENETPPFDVSDFAKIFERFVVTTEAWQAFILDIRKIYRWEDPWRSFRWACLFWFLWYTQHIVGYLYFRIIYTVVKNKFFPTSIDTIRASVRRSADTEARAQAWSDLIQKHGEGDWVEPLMDEVGPIIQMHLSDFTDFLEILANFYRWERPEKTIATVSFFVVCLLISLLADMAFCVKLVWLILGGAFWFVMPIRSHLPRYRMVVNVLRWVFWDIPTHAELGIIELQEKSIIRDAEHLKSHQPALWNGSDSTKDFIGPRAPPAPYYSDECYTFRAYQGLHKGELKVMRHGIEYTRSSGTTAFSYSDVLEMQKPDIGSKREKATSIPLGENAGCLTFILNDEETIDLILRKSDQMKVFNLVLGWSGLKWQVQQQQRTARAGDAQTKKSNRATLDRSIKRVLV